MSDERFGDADGCLSTLWVCAKVRECDGAVEGDANGDGGLTCMRERPRLSLSEKARRIRER